MDTARVGLSSRDMEIKGGPERLRRQSAPARELTLRCAQGDGPQPVAKLDGLLLGLEETTPK